MAQGPSIQSYFDTKSSHQRGIRSRIVDSTNDGFTKEELESALYPPPQRWQPQAEYQDVDIISLTPGPGCVAIMGRIVNFYDMATPSKMPHAAKGCLKIIVKDDTGSLVVCDCGL